MTTHVTRLTLRGWSGLNRSYDLLGRSALVRGPNGAGKTALCDALRFALFAAGRRGKRPEDAWRHARPDALALAVAVETDAGLAWERGLERQDDGRLAVRLELEGRRLKPKAADAALAAELRPLEALLDAAAYHSLSPQERRGLLLALLGAAAPDPAAEGAAFAARLAAARGEIAAELWAVVTRPVLRVAPEERIEAARAEKNSRAADLRAADAAWDAMRSEAEMAGGGGRELEAAEATLATARKIRIVAERAAETAAGRRLAHDRAVAEVQAAEVALGETQAVMAELAADPPPIEAYRFAGQVEMDLAHDSLGRARAASGAALAGLGQAQAANGQAAERHRAAQIAVADNHRRASPLEGERNRLVSAPASEALSCYGICTGSPADTWVRLGVILRALAATDRWREIDTELAALADARGAYEIELAASKDAAAAAAARLGVIEAAVFAAQNHVGVASRALAERQEVYENARRVAFEHQAEQQKAADAARKRAAFVGRCQDRLAYAVVALEEAEDADVDAASAILVERTLAESAAADRHRVAAEGVGRRAAAAQAHAARSWSDVLDRAATAVFDATLAAREERLAALVRPLAGALDPIIMAAWPSPRGATAQGCYVELETLHGGPAAELGVTIQYAAGGFGRVSRETMSGAQGAVFDAALACAFAASGGVGLAVVAVELDALAPMVAVALLGALSIHASSVQVIAMTWQTLQQPGGWEMIDA